MGLAHTAAHVIWFVALIGAVHMVVDAYLETAPSLAEARRTRDELSSLSLSTQLDEPFFCWNQETLKLSVAATNAGEATLATGEFTFLVDGLFAGGWVANVETTYGASFWPPGYVARFNKTNVATEPERVLMLSPTGVTAYAEHRTCPELSSIVVEPATASMEIGDARTFRAVGYDQFGALFDGSPYSWSSDCGATSLVDGETVSFTAGTLAGPCTLTATSGEIQGTAVITIAPDPPATIVVSNDPTGVGAGSTAAFSAVVYDQYGNVNGTAPVSWSTNAGSISTTGVLTAQTTAQMGRTVTATSTHGATGSATVDVYADVPATALVAPDGAGVTAGGTQAYTATLRDAYGNVNSTAPIIWSTDGGSISAAGLLTAQTTAATGKTVTATSGAASDSATFDVIAAAPASALVTPDGAGVTAGTTRAYSAVLYDAYGNVNSTAPVSWSTNAGSISGAGVLTAQTTAATGRTVTATSGAASDVATVDVIAAAPASMVVAPDNVGVTAGGTRAFTTTIYDVYGNVNSTATVTWSTNAGSISVGGVLTAQTTAQLGRSVTATTTVGAVSDTATVDVYAAAPSTITVSPNPTIVNTTLTRQFTATVRDAYGNLNTTASVSWSATRGSVSTSGLYTAPSTTGADTVTATSGAASGQATVSVQKAIHISAIQTFKSNATATSFKRNLDTVEARATIVDHLGNVVQGVSVTLEWRRPNSNVDHTDTLASDASGRARGYWAPPNNAPPGEWSAHVTQMTGTDLWWNTAANVATSVTFTVTN